MNHNETKDTGETPESRLQEPKILRKRGARAPEKAALLKRGSLEPMSGKSGKPGLFAFTMEVLYKNLYLIGITLLRYRLRAKRKLKRAGANAAAALKLRLKRVGARIAKLIVDFWEKFKAPFLRIRRTYREVKPDIRSKRLRGKFPLTAYLTILETVGRLILKIIATIFNYTAPVLAAVFFFMVVNQWFAEPTVSVLTYNGEVMGYLDSRSEFNAAAQEVRDRVTINGDSAFEVLNPNFEFMKKSQFEQKRDDPEDASIPAGVGKLEKDELVDKLILASNADVEEAYGLYVNGQFLGAVVDKDAILKKFDEIKNASRTGKPDEELVFTKSIRLTRQGLYPRETITAESDLIETISRDETSDEIYIVKAGDSPSLIADKTGVPYSVLQSLNPDIEENLTVGKEIYTQVARPYMSVESTYTDIVEEEVPFETVKVENATYARGYSNVFQEGVNGLREVTYRVSTMDGLERRRVEIGETILKYPVTERITVGINNPTVVTPVTPTQPSQTQSGGQTTTPPQQTITAAPTSTGFIRPVPAGVGYISCYLGGYPGHTGIDIAVMGGTGTPILASASGVVTKAVNSNVGYGRHIIIDHGNGYTTLYAHNSALYVSVGDRVGQGQVIAAMGRTGNATGVHVHFEVKYNGRIQNPVDYVGRY